jgi:hypothetical protein
MECSPSPSSQDLSMSSLSSTSSSTCPIRSTCCGGSSAQWRRTGSASWSPPTYARLRRVRWVGNGGAFAPLTLAISTSRRLPWRWRRRGCASTRLHGRRGACLRATWPNGRSATSLGRFVRLCLQFWIELLSRSICMIRFWPSADTALKRRRPQRHPRSERPLALKGAIPVTSGQTSFRSNCTGSDKTHVVT